jgi:phenylacetate-CoA ligase
MTLLRPALEPIDRADLGMLGGPSAPGWLACSTDGDVVGPLDRGALATAQAVTAETLMMAGVGPGDRVAVALNSDGAAVGAQWALAATDLGAAACPIGARQPRRLLHLVAAHGIDVLVATPTVVRRLALAARGEGRAPRSLGLRLVVLTGELPRRGTGGLADALGASLAHVVADPVFGVAVASRREGEASFAAPRRRLVRTAPLGIGGGLVEWVLHPAWDDRLAEAGVRSGLVAATPGPGALGVPRWTIGSHVLVRGRWLSLPHLAGLVGAEAGPGAAWQLVLDRHLASDRAVLRVSSGAGRLADLLDATLPVRVGVVVEDGIEGPPVLDHRGEHLGRR